MSVDPATVENKKFVPIPQRLEEPRVDILRDGEVVRTIRVSCTCGREVDIDCEYGDEPGR